MEQSSYEKYRYFLKDSIRKTVDFSKTDQSIGLHPPPIEKPYQSGKATIPLTTPSDFVDEYTISLQSAISRRESRRQFSKESVSLMELSFLLWATQGIRQMIDYGQALRTVPSAGARHSLETYLAILNVDTLSNGFYRYLPVSHRILVEKLDSLRAENHPCNL